MSKPQSEEKKYQLSNLFVESIGLVRRGANKSPFFFVKSESGQQGENMSDETKEAQVETPDSAELEEFRAWKAAQADPPAAKEVLETPGVVDFAEALALQEKRLSEDFAAKLAQEQAKTEKLTEAFAESERKRRLMQFTDQAATFDNLPIGAEQFGEDLMEMADGLPQETFDRLLETLRAANEAVEQGDLFSQFAQPVKADEYGDPFLVKIDKLAKSLVEKDPTKNADEAYAEAMTIASDLYRDEAKAFAIRSIPKDGE
jgi:hypothetical protein